VPSPPHIDYNIDNVLLLYQPQ